MILRIVTWNCCRGKAAIKLPPMVDLRPDVVCIQEIARPVRREAGSALWCGQNQHQGLLVLARDQFCVQPVKRKPIRAKHFLPVQIDGPLKFNLLGTWAKPSERRPHYVTTLLRGIAAYQDFIKSAPTIFIGDLNTQQFVANGDPHAHLVEVLQQEFGLVSAYHEYFGEQHGGESRYTYFDRTRRGKPYHIDYCFIPRSWLPKLETVTVGAAQVYGHLSDHVPVTIDFAF